MNNKITITDAKIIAIDNAVYEVELPDANAIVFCYYDGDETVNIGDIVNLEFSTSSAGRGRIIVQK